MLKTRLTMLICFAILVDNSVESVQNPISSLPNMHSCVLKSLFKNVTLCIFLKFCVEKRVSRLEYQFISAKKENVHSVLNCERF